MIDLLFAALSLVDPQALAILFLFAAVAMLLWLGAAVVDRLGRRE